MRERSAVGVEAHARERAQGRDLVGVQVARGAGGSPSRRCPAGRRALPRARPAAPRCCGCSGIRYDAGSWLTTTRSQATPPHDQRRSACASERSRPRPCGDAGGDEDDRPVARDAEAPEQPPVADVVASAVAAGACARSSSDSAVASVCIAAKFSALMRISRRRMPVSVADISEARSMLPSWRYLSITARSVAAIVGGGGAEGEPRLGARRRSAGAPPTRRPGRGRCRASRRPRLRRAGGGSSNGASGRLGVAVAAEPALPVDLDPDRRRTAGSAAARKLAASRRLVGRPAAACARTRAPGDAACHSALTKRFENAGMRLVGTRIDQRDLERRQQLEVDRPLAAVVQDDAAELDVVLGADPDRGRGFELGPGRAEGDAVGVQAAVVMGGGVGRGMLGQRHRPRLAVPAHVEEPALRVAQRVVAHARDRRVAAPAHAGAVRAQRDGVAAVREQVGRLDRRHAGRDLAEHAGRALAAARS